MPTLSAKAAKNGFGRLIDLARLGPVIIEKHGRPVVVVLAVEEYERLRDRVEDKTTIAREMRAKRTQNGEAGSV